MIHMQISVIIMAPDGIPTTDFKRAAGNYLVDLLPNAPTGVTERKWDCSHATIHSVVKIEDDEL